MADGLYLLTLCMTHKIAKIAMVEKACLFIYIFYAPGFLKSSLTAKAPLIDLKAFQDVFEIRKLYPEL